MAFRFKVEVDPRFFEFVVVLICGFCSRLCTEMTLREPQQHEDPNDCMSHV